MRTRSRTLAAIAAITLLAFPLAACGPDDDGDPPGEGTSTPTSTGAVTSSGSVSTAPTSPSPTPGDTSPSGPATSPDGPEDPAPTLVVVPEDGPRIAVEGLAATCAPAEFDPERTVVRLATPGLGQEGELGFIIEIDVDDVADGADYELPVDQDTGFILFVSTGERGVENSSSLGDSRGRVTIDPAACESGQRFRGEIEARLGSEYADGEILTVTGMFDVEITEA